MTTADVDMAELFGNLHIEESSEPLPTFRGVGQELPNPFGPTIDASAENGSTYNIYVPPSAVSRAVRLIREAANKSNRGVRIVVNMRRDENQRPVKNDEGKVIYLAESKGDNKGKVLIRYQALATRKQQAPRPYSIVKSKDTPDLYHVKHRESGSLVFAGTKDEARAHLASLRTASTTAGAA